MLGEPWRRATDEHSDAALVAAAAGAVEISEHDVFALAYRRWYGRAAEARVLDAHFGAYLRGGEVPAWVRHTARALVAGEPAALAAAARRRDERLAAQGPARHPWLAVGATLAAAALALWMVARPPSAADPNQSPAGTAAGEPAPLSCQAGGGPGLRVFEHLARALAAAPPPECR